ncbi:MAG: peptidoglycan-binding protein [Pseudomonadota bacterium]|nr:peptidoglycan-binding protein [Pseudomonadota bacterium]
MKGIDPRARARAKTAARKQGKTLGEWLNSVILDDSDPASAQWDDALEAYPGFDADVANDDDRLLRAMINRLSERIEKAEQASSSTLSELDKAITQLATNVAKVAQRQGAKLDETDKSIDTVNRSQGEIAERLRQLEGKIAETGGKDTKAIHATVMKLARRLYEHENDVSARLHEQEQTGGIAARELIDDTNKRVDKLESRADNLNEFAQRIENSERRTHDTARTLETSFARLDERLRALETRNTNDNVELERRFERLQDDVARIVTDLRDQVGSTTGRVDEADRRQADSMARLGDEISRLAQAIDQRLTESERRAEDARQDRRAEETLNHRIDEVRQENRESMRRMAEQVTRLGRSLADRIQRSEERSTKAVETVTDRMADALERIESARPDREAELEDRLRQSEERTASRIEDALQGVQDKLAAVRSETEETLTPVQRAMTALADRLEAIENRDKPEASEPSEETSPAAAQPERTAPVIARSEDADPFDFDAPLGPPPQAEVPVSSFEAGKTDPFLTDEPFVPNAPVLREPQAAPARAAKPAAAAPEAPRGETRRQKRRRLAEEKARGKGAAPAPQSVAEVEAAILQPGAQTAQLQPRPAPKVGATADADFLAAARETTRATAYTPYERENRPLKFSRATLIAIPVMALIALGGAGAILILGATQGEGERSIAETRSDSAFIAQVEAGLTATPQSAERENAPAEPTQADTPPATPPRNQVADSSGAITPSAERASNSEAAAPTGTTSEPVDTAATTRATTDTSARPTLESAAADGDPIARYQLGMRQLEAGDTASGAILLRRAAEQGVPAAQYRYAKLLETGEGVDIDLEAARRWTERAANAGHRRAMHNLAVMYYYGSGAPREFETAARWFQEAALLGLSDSQFNLALLFESGQGVPLSLADAYAWYMISANSSDPTARERAIALEELLEPEALNQARQVVANFQPRPIDAQANGIYQGQAWDRTPVASAADIERAQGFLSVLGYGPGPIDGAIGQRTREAIMAFEADQGLPRTGHVDDVLLERLSRAVAN